MSTDIPKEWTVRRKREGVRLGTGEGLWGPAHLGFARNRLLDEAEGTFDHRRGEGMRRVKGKILKDKLDFPFLESS